MVRSSQPQKQQAVQLHHSASSVDLKALVGQDDTIDSGDEHFENLAAAQNANGQAAYWASHQ